MANSADALRRWLGSFSLAVAAGMLIWGKMVLERYLDGLLFVLYWSVCFLFTFAAIVIALLDVRAVRRRTRAEQQELMRRTLHEIEQKQKDDPANPKD